MPGDTVGVVALSGPVDPTRLEAGCAALRGFGYGVRVASNIGCKGGPLGLAGTDAQRLDGYRELLLDPAVRAILFARGGYGIAGLLDSLDPEEIRRTPKIHCGFSDFTALSAFLLSRCGICSFHGPMVAAELASPLAPIAARFFPAALEGRAPHELDLPEADVLVDGDASGRLEGGCLSLLAAHVAGPGEFDYEGALLFLEDVAEEAYRIDRMLVTLLRAGRFAKLRGILIGSLSGITFGGREDAGRLREVLLDRLGPLGIPIVMGLPFGHRGPNITVPVGAHATWDAGARVLRFEEEIVS